MGFAISPKLKERIWKGDKTAVAEMRSLYAIHPEEALLPFASTLYSFRNTPQFATELMELRYTLTRFARRFCDRDDLEARSAADQADVLSTILEWLSRHEEFTANEQSTMLDLALDVAQRGILYVHKLPSMCHSVPLLMLTAARIRIRRKEKGTALSYLMRVENQAHNIGDASQKTRVYRKLGMLYRQAGKFSKGLSWGIRACFVTGTPLHVRLKSGAALLGVDC